MKILRNVIGVLLLMTLLCGCQPMRRTLPDYRERAFRAEIRFAVEGVIVCAEVETTLADGVLMPSRMRLLTPPSLSGIALLREGEEVILCSDGLRTPCVGAERWWEMAELLCASGKLCYVCDTELEGLPLAYAEIGGGAEVYGIWCDGKSGIPKKITHGDRALTVLRMESIEART